MIIQCTEREKHWLLDMLSRTVVCKECILQDTCRKNGMCTKSLERGITFVEIPELDEASIGRELKRLSALMLYLKSSVKSKITDKRHFGELKNLIKRTWDNVGSGISSEYLEKITDYYASHDFIKSKDFLRICKKIARGENGDKTE